MQGQRVEMRYREMSRIGVHAVKVTKNRLKLKERELCPCFDLRQNNINKVIK